MLDFINAAKDAEIVRLKVAHAGLLAALMDIIARGNEGRGVGRMIETAQAALIVHGAA